MNSINVFLHILVVYLQPFGISRGGLAVCIAYSLSSVQFAVSALHQIDFYELNFEFVKYS